MQNNRGNPHHITDPLHYAIVVYRLMMGFCTYLRMCPPLPMLAVFLVWDANNPIGLAISPPDKSIPQYNFPKISHALEGIRHGDYM
tara:strand:- start:209 stop:466 length:258 start_codon:yes stop_codon:yes gene_type:complete